MVYLIVFLPFVGFENSVDPCNLQGQTLIQADPCLIPVIYKAKPSLIQADPSRIPAIFTAKLALIRAGQNHLHSETVRKHLDPTLIRPIYKAKLALIRADPTLIRAYPSQNATKP